MLLTGDRRRLQVSLFLIGAGYGLFLYLLPLYVRALGGSAAAVGLVLGVQAALGAVATLLVGPLADRLGRRVVMRTAALASPPGVACWFLAPHWTWLILGAALVGLSVAGFPAMVAYLSHAESEPVGLFGSVFAFFSLGTVATPGLGGVIAAHLHAIRPVFGLSCVLLCGAALVLWPITAQPLVPRREGPRGLRALIGNRRFMAIYGFHTALLCTMSLTTSFLGPYLQDIDHASDAVIGLLGTCVSLGEVAISLSLGRISGRLGRLGTLFAVQAALALSLVMVLTIHLVPLLVVPFLLRGVIVTGSTLLFAVAAGMLPASERGAGFGLMESSYQMGAMGGASVGGLLYGSNPLRPFQVSLALLLLTTMVSTLLRPVLTDGQPAEAAGLPLSGEPV